MTEEFIQKINDILGDEAFLSVPCNDRDCYIWLRVRTWNCVDHILRLCIAKNDDYHYNITNFRINQICDHDDITEENIVYLAYAYMDLLSILDEVEAQT